MKDHASSKGISYTDFRTACDRAAERSVHAPTAGERAEARAQMDRVSCEMLQYLRGLAKTEGKEAVASRYGIFDGFL